MRILKATQDAGEAPSLVWHAMDAGDKALCGVRVPDPPPAAADAGERYCPACMNRVDTHVAPVGGGTAGRRG
ncbi:hypothetical protein [Streptomyces sp. SPB074]|uniref:hypothetical protein n=1 Tax=Streptomyces sp. (strain SPB074) TaxID=465543 RepID=UPI00017FE8E6|nr:hypothetical protein [Streptomyces sp. SPB074]EDY43488.1 hypothetical protein SSBG_01450 [Streptomyces sp. SPB074]